VQVAENDVDGIKDTPNNNSINAKIIGTRVRMWTLLLFERKIQMSDYNLG